MGIPEAGAMWIGIWEASQVCRRVTVYSTGPDSLTYNIDIPEPAVLHITRAWRTILTYQSLAYFINLPEPGVLNRFDLLLWVPVHVHVEHEAAEGGTQEVRQPVILHTPAQVAA